MQKQMRFDERTVCEDIACSFDERRISEVVKLTVQFRRTKNLRGR